MSDILRDWLKQLGEAAMAKAKEIGKNVGVPLAQDTAAWLATCTTDVARWGQMYLDGQLTAPEVESLIKGQGDLFAMKGLTAAGLAAVELEKLKAQMLDVVGGLAGATLKSLK
jgi:CubicO group peptidase (beta-lactamase class C family)